MIAMVDISVVKMPIFAVGIAGVVIIVAVILVAIAAKRPGVAAVLGGLILLAIGLGAVLLPVWAYTSRGHVYTTESQGGTKAAVTVTDGTAHVYTTESQGGTMTVVSPQIEPPFGEGGHVRSVSWNVSLFGIVLMVALPLALLIALASWLTSRRPPGAGGSRVGWLPALLLIPLVALFFLGSVRFSSSRRHAPQFEALHQDFGQQHAEISRRAAEMNAHVQNQFAKMNIHELMDKTDAPRIAIAPEAPPAPAASEDSTSDESGSSADASVAAEKTAPKHDKTVQANNTEEASESKVADAENSDKEADKVKNGGPSSAASANEPPAAVAASTEKSTPETSEAPATNEPLVTAADEATDKLDASRPTWVVTPPKRIGDVQQEVIVTDEWATEEECDRARDIGLMLKTYERVQRLIGAPYQGYLLDHRMATENAWGDSRLTELARMGITVDYVHREIAKDEYLETADRSFGKMLKLYTLVEFSPSVDRELRARWEARERQERVWMLGAGAGWVLGLLGFVYGLLKVDTWTKGYYTKRLFLGVPGAIIGGFLLYALINFR